MSTTRKRPIVAVFGGNDKILIKRCNLIERAKALGAEIASRRLIVLTGGTGPADKGVKGAAIDGAKGSPWIGVDQTGTVRTSEQDTGIVISTDLGHKRNYLEASLCDAAICLEGGEGTVSEATFALALQRPVAFWGDDWRHELHLSGDEHATTVKSMVTQTFNRVGETPTGKPRFDALVSKKALDDGLSSLPPFMFFTTNTAASAVLDWITRTLSTIGSGLGGSFPPIDGYDETIRRYGVWLSRNAT